jgi:DNA mismatch repair protein MutL
VARVKQLSKHLINQIAAGEVIERPASVVKELAENSIDAGAKRISVEVSNECRDIRVADNGGGIHPDDIVLAFSKHATSKIETDEDLFAIGTLGFRGEALSSIISIAKVVCTTRTAEFETGTRVKCENSEVVKTRTGCAVGTIMEVKDLFYNLPARLKFLKNPNTEFAYIQELIQSLALSHPDVSFELKKNGKTILKTAGNELTSAGLLQVIKEIYSQETAGNLKEVLKTDKISGFKISGYVSTPDYTRSSKKSYHIYINSRTVKCPVFQKAIDTAYKNLIAGGKYPFVVLNLEIAPGEVDVNVHPSKKEVRYKNTNQIFNFIFTSVQGGLENYVEHPPSNSGAATAPPPASAPTENVLNFAPPGVFYDKKEDTMYVSDMEKVSASVPQAFSAQEKIFEAPPQAAPGENIVGQYKNTYILIEKEDGLEIVDQHIAEERYIYEKLKNEKEPVSQLLFVSDVVEVSGSEAELIKENIDKFEKFGYGIDFLKDNELIFRKVPQLIANANPKDILADILGNIDGGIEASQSGGGLEEKILITTACKASVKAGQKLSTWQMQEIIKKWRTTKMPYTCPHGRPITKTIPHKEIAAFFQRQS